MKKLFLIAVIAMLLTAMVPAFAGTPSQPHNADAMWIEPYSVYFTNNATLGTKFNVTVAMNITGDVFSYSVGMHYNRTYLKATKAGFTDPPTSNYFTGHPTTLGGPIIDTSYLLNGSVLASETCSGTDYIPGPHSGTLIFVEFQIMKIPDKGQTLSDAFNISKEYDGDTYVTDPNVVKKPITVYDATYGFQWLAPTAKPFMGIEHGAVYGTPASNSPVAPPASWPPLSWGPYPQQRTARTSPLTSTSET